MKLIFFGTSDFSRPIYEALKKEGYPAQLASQFETGKSPIPLEKLKELKPDICIVAAYGKIIPKEYLEILHPPKFSEKIWEGKKFGFLNIHPSLLPKYRGASPIQTAILNGDQEIGVTIILMDEKIDHGSILGIKKQELGIRNYKELEKELAELGAQLLIEILPKWIKGEIKPIEQNHSEATYTKKFSWLDGKIDCSKSAYEIERKIRALNPEPGTWTNWNTKILKILEALPASNENDNFEIGQVFLTEDNKAAIKCGFDSAILPKIVQLEGKKPMEIKDFLNGHKDFINSLLN